MKVDFSLTFEEYTDAYKSRLRRPDRSAAYSLAIVGLLISGMGLLLLEAGPESSRSDGVRFLVVGVLLLLGASVAWATARRRTRQTDLKKLRLEYERFASEVREFEVTERGWRYKSRYGDNSHDWIAFRWFEESDQVLKLAAPPNLYLIPKRVLGEQGLQLLRQCIEKASPPDLVVPQFVLQYRISARDYVEACVKDGWHRQRLVFILAYLFVVLCFFFYLYQAVAGRELGRSLNAVIAGLVLVGIVVAERAYYLLQYADVREHYNQEIQMSVMEGGIVVRTSKTLEVQRYSLLLKAIQSRAVLLLYVANNRFYIVPKRAFTGPQLEQFGRLLAAQVPAK